MDIYSFIYKAYIVFLIVPFIFRLELSLEIMSNTAYEKFELSPEERVDRTYESVENYENVGLRDNAPHDSEGNVDTYI